MQRVRLIHSVYGAHKNGANTVINSLLNSKKRFLENGIDIDSLRPEGSFRDSSVETVPVGIKKLRNSLVDAIKKWLTEKAQTFGWAAALLMKISEQRSAKKIVKKYFNEKYNQGDVLFFHTFFTCYYYLKYRKKYQPVVLVLHTNGEPFKMQRIYYKALEGSKYYRELLKKEEEVLKKADRIVFVANAPRLKFLECHSYVSPEKVFCVYNGITKDEWKKSAELHKPVEVVCVASITERKGQHYIVEALRTIDNVNTLPVHFTFVGDGSDRIRLEQEVKESHLDKYCTFVGVTNDVAHYLKQSDIYILPSEDEGLPMAILEAMRAFLPIVSTPVGGIPEMIEDGYNGMLIEPSKEGVLKFIEKIGDTDWIQMGQNARKVFEEKFTIEKMVDDYSRILNFEGLKPIE